MPQRVGSLEIQLQHVLRTKATLLLRKREPLKTVSHQLGHASATITLTVHVHR